MKKLLNTWIVIFCTTLLLSGCRSVSHRSPISALGAAQNSADFRIERMLIWKAHLNIDVWNVSNAVSQATEIVTKNGGYIEQKNDSGNKSASLGIRIPVKLFKSAIGSFESLGTVTYRNVEAEDVTEQYVDIDARLKNRIVLRDRLRQLLAKAKDVKDILAIETELNRIQGEIDSMEGRIKLLKGQVDFATIRLTFEQKEILGPLGYAIKGLWWGLEKLFVIRD